MHTNDDTQKLKLNFLEFWKNISNEDTQTLISLENTSIVENKISKYCNENFPMSKVLIMVFTFVLFIYYNNKRKDKLRVYEDNLNKYFREKENQAKIEIAGKILDTIASGKLSEEQENRLISSLGTNSKDSKVTLLQENKKPKVNVIHDLNEIDDIKQ